MSIDFTAILYFFIRFPLVVVSLSATSSTYYCCVLISRMTKKCTQQLYFSHTAEVSNHRNHYQKKNLFSFQLKKKKVKYKWHDKKLPFHICHLQCHNIRLVFSFEQVKIRVLIIITYLPFFELLKKWGQAADGVLLEIF